MGVFKEVLLEKSSKNSHDLKSEDIAKVKSDFHVTLKIILDKKSDPENLKICLNQIETIKKLSNNNIIKSFYSEPENSFIDDEAPSTNKIINKERKENLEFFNHYKDSIKEKYNGKYIVIANKNIKASGKDWNKLKNEALDANHRFILKVE